MKTTLSRFAVFTSITIAVAVAGIVASCTKAKPGATSSTTTVNCADPGTLANIGSNAEKGYTSTAIRTVPGCEICDTSTGSHLDVIGFDNTNLNLSVSDDWNSCGCSGAAPGTIEDMGIQSCPTFTNVWKPIDQVVAFTPGHGYVGLFADGHIIKFTVGSISNGTAQIDYVWQ